jgi:hypothetical protein
VEVAWKSLTYDAPSVGRSCSFEKLVMPGSRRYTWGWGSGLVKKGLGFGFSSNGFQGVGFEF